jgi:hypothetical protein
MERKMLRCPDGNNKQQQQRSFLVPSKLG